MRTDLEAEIDEILSHLQDDLWSNNDGWAEAKTALLKTVDLYVEERERLARVDELKRPISEYHQAELEDKGYDFYFALRTRLDELKALRQQVKEES